MKKTAFLLFFLLLFISSFAQQSSKFDLFATVGIDRFDAINEFGDEPSFKVVSNTSNDRSWDYSMIWFTQDKDVMFNIVFKNNNAKAVSIIPFTEERYNYFLSTFNFIGTKIDDNKWTVSEKGKLYNVIEIPSKSTNFPGFAITNHQ